mgnify:CR=1 FL=1
MHILLVQPRVNAEPSYPLALAAMVPLLEGAGHTVEGIDLMFVEDLFNSFLTIFIRAYFCFCYGMKV